MGILRGLGAEGGSVKLGYKDQTIPGGMVRGLDFLAVAGWLYRERHQPEDANYTYFYGSLAWAVCQEENSFSDSRYSEGLEFGEMLRLLGLLRRCGGGKCGKFCKSG